MKAVESNSLHNIAIHSFALLNKNIQECGK
jgi:hypothetical protein